MKKNIIFDFNRTVFDPEQNILINGALDTLEYLRQNSYRLFLLSRKEKGRKDMIYNTGIAGYFECIKITEAKCLNDFYKLKIFAPEEDWYVVGDRVRDEIRLGNQAGMTTIWFQSGVYASELPTSIEEIPKHIIYSLNEIIKIIH